MLRLPAFSVLAPNTLSDALALLAEDTENTAVLAGGTDLLPNLKRRLSTPKRLLSLRQLHELKQIEVSDTELRIGSAVRLCEVAAHPVIREEAVALVQAIEQLATIQIRNTATLGGNLCLDTRCEYFNQSELWRQAIGYCKKKLGDVCWVATSSPRCLAVSSSDTAPALAALGARVTLAAVQSEREEPLSNFYQNDGAQPLLRRPEELLVGIRVPRKKDRRSTYWKLRRRGSFDFPLLGVACAVQFSDENLVSEVRLFLGAVSSQPLWVDRAPALLCGRPLLDDQITRTALAAQAVAKPMAHADMTVSYRKTMVKPLVELALREVRGDDVRAERQRFLHLGL